MHTIVDLLDGIEAGTIALADFQRDFDWSTQAIRSLLATVLMGWPAGSLLVISGHESRLLRRPFEGAPPLVEEPDLIVLDGQQRLTALLRALSDADPMRYTLPLDALRAGNVEDIEEGFQLVESSGDSGWPAVSPPTIPLSALRSEDQFFAWRTAVESSVLELDEDIQFDLSQAYRNHLHWLHDYRFPVLELDSSVDQVSIARIFERVNRTGLRLGSFDLVVARAYSPSWNLRERWTDARYSHPRLDPMLGDNGLPVLQAIALQAVRNVRQSAVLDLDAGLVTSRWDAAVDAVDSAVEFLSLHCGVRRPEWLPYRALLLVLSGLALELPLDDHIATLRRYVLTRSFGLRFDVAANTRVVEDFDQLLDALRTGIELPAPPARADVLLSSTRQRHTAVWRALLCCLAMRDPLDLTGSPLDLGDPEAPGEGLSVVPVGLLSADPDGRRHLRTLNMVLAKPATAIALRRSAVAEQDVPLIAHGWSEEAGQTQLLPRDWPGLRAAPERLLRERLALLAKYLDYDFGQRVADPTHAL